MEKMEKQELEKIIKKLESLDIRAWSLKHDALTAETGGIRFYFNWYGICSLKIEDTENGFSFSRYPEDKSSKKIFKEFYTKTCGALNKYQKENLKEKLNNLLE